MRDSIRRRPVDPRRTCRPPGYLAPTRVSRGVRREGLRAARRRVPDQSQRTATTASRRTADGTEHRAVPALARRRDPARASDRRGLRIRSPTCRRSRRAAWLRAIAASSRRHRATGSAPSTPWRARAAQRARRVPQPRRGTARPESGITTGYGQGDPAGHRGAAAGGAKLEGEDVGRRRCATMAEERGMELGRRTVDRRVWGDALADLEADALIPDYSTSGRPAMCVGRGPRSRHALGDGMTGAIVIGMK